MANRRASEQFAWDHRKENRLRCYVADGTSKTVMAQLLRTSVKNVTAKLDELGLEVRKVKLAGGPKPSLNPEKWGLL